jgi:uncharacterized protein (DUF983 family)
MQSLKKIIHNLIELISNNKNSRCPVCGSKKLYTKYIKTYHECSKYGHIATQNCYDYHCDICDYTWNY